MRRVFLLALVLAACGKSEPGWLKKLHPQMQQALDAHAARLKAALALVPPRGELTPLACTGLSFPPGDKCNLGECPDGLLCSNEVCVKAIPTLSIDLANQLAGGGVKVLSQKPGKTHPHFLDGEAYRKLLGDTYLYSPPVFTGAMAELGGDYAGVFLVDKMDEPAASGSDITKPGHVDTWFVLLDLKTPKVVARTRVSAETSSMIMIHNDENVQKQLLEDLEGQAAGQAAAALAPGCTGFTLD